MKISFTLITEFGSFTSREWDASEEEYSSAIEMTKKSWSDAHLYKSGYEIYLPDGFLIATPGILEKSILKINKIDS